MEASREAYTLISVVGERVFFSQRLAWSEHSSHLCPSYVRVPSPLTWHHKPDTLEPTQSILSTNTTCTFPRSHHHIHSLTFLENSIQAAILKCMQEDWEGRSIAQIKDWCTRRFKSRPVMPQLKINFPPSNFPWIFSKQKWFFSLPTVSKALDL